jgi:hypothetical protein
VTSFLTLRGDVDRGMLGRVASLGDGVASSLGRLLPQARPRQQPQLPPTPATTRQAPLTKANPRFPRRTNLLDPDVPLADFMIAYDRSKLLLSVGRTLPCILWVLKD